jgi:hypothetical protein
MIERMLTALFSEHLDSLAQEIEARANSDLQNSTCSDTIGDDEFALSNELFEVFEVSAAPWPCPHSDRITLSALCWRCPL